MLMEGFWGNVVLFSLAGYLSWFWWNQFKNWRIARKGLDLDKFFSDEDFDSHVNDATSIARPTYSDSPGHASTESYVESGLQEFRVLLIQEDRKRREQGGDDGKPPLAGV